MQSAECRMTSHPAAPGALLKGEPKKLNIIRADFANTRTYACAHAKSGSYRNINNSTTHPEGSAECRVQSGELKEEDKKIE